MKPTYIFSIIIDSSCWYEVEIFFDTFIQKIFQKFDTHKDSVIIVISQL